MGLFPAIQSLCPYKGNLSDIMDGDICRLCKKEVFDLTAMNDGERVSFLSGCTDQVCVSYRVKPNSLIAALALGASAVAVPAFAQSADTPDLTQEEALAEEEMMIIVGGMRDGAVTRIGRAVRVIGTDAVTLLPFADIECVPLPGFAAPRHFQF